MRGKGRLFFSAPARCGITPAYAGKSYVFTLLRARSWDHPRVCGEKERPHNFSEGTQGSPPRMRGKGNVEGVELGAARITPAYAGKSMGKACAEVSK